MFPGRGRGRGMAAAVSARGRGRAVPVAEFRYADEGTVSARFTREHLLSSPIHSQPTTIGCMQWSLTLSASHDSNLATTDVNVSVNCLQNANALANFACTTDLTLRLVPKPLPGPASTYWASDEDVYHAVRDITFGAQTMAWTYASFTKYSVLSNKVERFADDVGQFEIEAQVQVKRVRYDLFPENEFDVDGDVVVIVGGRRFHVDKDYVAMHAPYLRALLTGPFNEAGQEEVTLQDTDPQDFLQFLRAVYPSARNVVIKADNVEAIAVLADRYNATALSAKCQEYLCSGESDNAITNLDKLKLAELGNLNQVKLHVMQRVELMDLSHIMTSYNWSSETLAMLQRKKNSATVPRHSGRVRIVDE